MSKQRDQLRDFTRASIQQFVGKVQSPTTVASDDKYLEISIDKIIPNSNQTRKFFDPEKLEELATSIRKIGIIEPLIVDENKNILAGERRFRAAKIAGKITIPIIIYKNLDDVQKDVFGLIENIQREDLRTIELADTLKSFRDNYHLSIREISQELGKPKSTVHDLLSIYQFLSEEILQFLRDLQSNIGIKKMIILKDIEKKHHIPAIKLMNEGYTINQIKEKFASNKKSEKKTVNPIKKISSFKKSLLKFDWEIAHSKPDVLIEEIDSLMNELTSIRKKINL